MSASGPKALKKFKRLMMQRIKWRPKDRPGAGGVCTSCKIYFMVWHRGYIMISWLYVHNHWLIVTPEKKLTQLIALHYGHRGYIMISW